ncbi:MAG TPA: VWA domain-containing protein [Acidimicrobiia bacterium]|nr:VWA domain-containing protein [Acidimicrobiia bacterium]
MAESGDGIGLLGRDAEGALVRMLVDFGERLRSAGIPVGSGELLAFCGAVAALDPGDLLDVYWGGRATLLTRRDQIPTYDRVFRSFFLDSHDVLPEPMKLVLKRSDIESQAVIEVPATEPGRPGKDEEEARLGLMASDLEIWRNKAFAACTDEELAALRRIMNRVRVVPPRRRSRRTLAAPAGDRPDLRRTVRTTMRTHGEPSELFWRRRRLKMRPLVLILDVSGSMADYSRNLLQFAYSTRRAATRVEVFCFGTRLTRITRALERRRADDALDQAARLVFDWEGGTRIGESLDTFVRQWGRRGMSRGSIVVICSDGLDRGDPAVLAGAMERLSRLSHKVVWMNPHKGDDRHFRPTTLGMMVAEPYIDLLLSGHDLASLEELADRLPELR